MDIIEGRARIADPERLGQATLMEEMGPGFGHFWIRDGRAGLGAVACERKLWITGLNEARLQFYGSVGAKLLFVF